MSFAERYKNLSLTQFLESLDEEDFFWFIKRLSGNDTGITGSHQVGVYVPRRFIEAIVPSIVSGNESNPSQTISCYLPSHDCEQQEVRAIYYNNKIAANGTRNEFRLTHWAGTPLQNGEYTGCICILAGRYMNGETELLGWVSESLEDDCLIEAWLGHDVEPGRTYLSCDIDKISRGPRLPKEWKSSFPSGQEIFNFIEEKIPQESATFSVDDLLLKRRDLEFKIFSKIENYIVMPKIQAGFGSVEEFIAYANRVTNRRKSRSGISLELHLDSIFRYEHLMFEKQKITENNNKPDFIFPSIDDYHNQDFPVSQLHMLAAKTCCKDRWRQVIHEADRIRRKHLFTLQQGLSSNQLKNMCKAGIVLVAPQQNISFFPQEFQKKIMNLTKFIEFIKSRQRAG